MKHETYALTKELRPDPNQPRKEFPAAALAERAESIRTHGITDALIVRKDPLGKTKWLIVEGEIRWRCAGALKLERVPISVREFADEAAVREYQRIVGTQRLNITALEEAAALNGELAARQKANPKFTVTDLAAVVGKSRAATYETLALLKISAPVRAALEAGQLDASKARLFATVPADKHAKLLEEATDPDYHTGSTMSVRKLQELIEEEYTRQLNTAGFERNREIAAPWVAGMPVKGEKGMIVTLPLCALCPKRSGNIEGAHANPHICTAVVCFNAKTKADGNRMLAEAKATGQTVIPAADYAKRQGNFSAAIETCYRDKKSRSFGTLAKLAGVAPALTLDEHGKAIEVFTLADKSAIYKKHKIKEYSYSGGGGSDRKAFSAYQKKEKLWEKAAFVATAEILPKVTKGGLHVKLWALLAAAVAGELGQEREAFVARRLGLTEKKMDGGSQLEAWLTNKARTDLDRQQFIVEGLLCARWNDGGYQTVKWGGAFKDLAALAGVNLDKIKAGLESAAHSKTKTNKKGKKK